LVPLGGNKWPVHGLVRQVHHERLTAWLLQEFQCVVGQDIRDIAVFLDSLAIYVDRRIVIDALSLETDPAIETGSRGINRADVPFAGVSRLVSSVMEQSRPGNQLMAERIVIAVSDYFVRAHVASREIARSARRAQGRGHEGIGEGNAFARDAVDVWSLDERVAGAGQRVESQIIDEDEQKIGAWLVLRQQGRGQGPQRFSSG